MRFAIINSYTPILKVMMVLHSIEMSKLITSRSMYIFSAWLSNWVITRYNQTRGYVDNIAFIHCSNFLYPFDCYPAKPASVQTEISNVKTTQFSTSFTVVHSDGRGVILSYAKHFAKDYKLQMRPIYRGITSRLMRYWKKTGLGLSKQVFGNSSTFNSQFGRGRPLIKNIDNVTNPPKRHMLIVIIA